MVLQPSLKFKTSNSVDRIPATVASVEGKVSTNTQYYLGGIV